MINVEELKKGDVVWVIKYVILWESQYGDDCIEIPTKIERKVFDYIEGDYIWWQDVDRIIKWHTKDMFKTEKEALKEIRKRRLEVWKEFDFDKVLKELEKLKKQIEEGK